MINLAHSMVYNLIDELLKSLYGNEAFPEITEAFKKNPFNQTAAIYNAPQNYGPMNLLYEKPTGYEASMIGFSIDL